MVYQDLSFALDLEAVAGAEGKGGDDVFSLDGALAE